MSHDDGGVLDGAALHLSETLREDRGGVKCSPCEPRRNSGEWSGASENAMDDSCGSDSVRVPLRPAQGQNQDRDKSRSAEVRRLGASAEQRVDINHASIAQLLKVPGLTPRWQSGFAFSPTHQQISSQGNREHEVYDRIKDFIIAHPKHVNLNDCGSEPPSESSSRQSSPTLTQHDIKHRDEKNRFSTVESSMPPTMVVPTEWRPRAPPPVANTNENGRG